MPDVHPEQTDRYIYACRFISIVCRLDQSVCKLVELFVMKTMSNYSNSNENKLKLKSERKKIYN